MADLRLNIGCGFKRLEGYVNVDAWAECGPDMRFTADADVWPFPDSSATAVVFEHSMEHMGETAGAFRHLIQELYRVCADGARVDVIVPHWRHDSFSNDPTHVRAITPMMLRMLDRNRNHQSRLAGDSESKLGFMWDVDFEFVEGVFVRDMATAASPILRLIEQGAGADPSQVTADMISLFNNIAMEIRMVLRACKPARVF